MHGIGRRGSPTSPTGHLLVGLGVDERMSKNSAPARPAAPSARRSPYGEMIGADVSVSPNTSTNASIAEPLWNSSTIERAVGAAKMQRSWLSASSGRGGCFQVKSIITPRKLVTVTPFSRT